LDRALINVRSKVDQSRSLYHQLALVVASVGGGKTILLSQLRKDDGFPLVNVNLELSKLLLDVPVKRRGIEAPRLLQEIIDIQNAPVVMLDNLEVLFDPSLSLNPLTCLKQLSRHRVIIASWTGSISDGCLLYAEPGHPEFRREPATDLLIVSLAAQAPPQTVHAIQ
jgi:hypothetical protein